MSIYERNLAELKKILKANPENIDVLNNLAKLYFKENHLDKALMTCKDIIKINPHHSNTYNNIGMIYYLKCQNNKAKESYTKALHVDPNHKQALNNLGIIYYKENNFDDAIKCFKKAIKIDNNYLDTINNLSSLEIENQKYLDGLKNNLRALSIDKFNQKSLTILASLLKKIKIKKYDASIEGHVITMLSAKNLITPTELSQSLLHLIKLNPQFQKIETLSEKNFSETNVNNLLRTLKKMPLLLKILPLIPISDLKIEKILTNIRKKILLEFEEINDFFDCNTFLSALCLNCLINEFLFPFTDKEKSKLEKLNEKVKNDIRNRKVLNESIILILCCYKRMIDFEWSIKLKNFKFEEVLKNHFDDYNTECIYKSEIRTVGDFKDNISNKIKQQYELHPYPRWVDISTFEKKTSLYDLSKKLKLDIKMKQIFEIKKFNGLIAGCGTGKQSIGIALKMPESTFLAIDLSKTSLSYALRKTKEMKINNINYFHCDILNLKNFNRKFNYIDCAGVLHHMDDPLKGWRILTECLEKNGLIRLGLYSRSARKDLLKLKSVIKKKYFSNYNDIRYVREKIINENYNLPEICSSQDFFSLSGFKDLLLNENEHQFDLLQIKNILSDLKLHFCGFELPNFNHISNLKNKFNDFDQYNLLHWNEFEKKYPNTFQNMYQFYCQKL